MIGYDAFFDNGFLWRVHQGCLVPLSMPHLDPQLSNRDAKDLIRRRRALMVRWDSHFDQPDSSAWWHVIKDQPEVFEGLEKKVRYMIRRAAKRFTAQACSRDSILRDGYAVYRSAFSRYKTFEPLYSESEFCKAVLDLPQETEFWAVFDSDLKMVAFSENLVANDACFYVSMWLEPEAMKEFSAYLLFHEMNKYYLNECSLSYVSDGARSINHETNIHDFLIRKFGFRKAYSKLHVVYSPWLAIAVATAYPIRNILKRIPFGPFDKASVLLMHEEVHREG